MSSGDNDYAEKRRLSDEEERARVAADTDAIRQQYTFEEPPEVGAQELGEIFDSPPLSDFYARAMREALHKEDLAHYQSRIESIRQDASTDAIKVIARLVTKGTLEEVLRVAEVIGDVGLSEGLVRAKIEIEEIEKLIKKRTEEYKAELKTL